MLEGKYGIDTTIEIKRSGNKSIDPQQYYRMIYNKIVDTIVDQLKMWYLSLEELEFIELFYFSKSEEYHKQFPVDALNSLKNHLW